MLEYVSKGTCLAASDTFACPQLASAATAVAGGRLNIAVVASVAASLAAATAVVVALLLVRQRQGWRRKDAQALEDTLRTLRGGGDVDVPAAGGDDGRGLPSAMAQLQMQRRASSSSDPGSAACSAAGQHSRSEELEQGCFAAQLQAHAVAESVSADVALHQTQSSTSDREGCEDAGRDQTEQHRRQHAAPNEEFSGPVAMRKGCKIAPLTLGEKSDGLL